MMIFHTDPTTVFSPTITGWVAPQFKSEFLLVGLQDNDTVATVTWNQSQEIPRPILRFDSTDSSIGSMAARALGAGTASGRDIQGTKVMAAYQPLADSQWKLLVKLDREAALAPLRQLALWVSLFVGVAAVGIGALLLLLWHQQRRSHQWRLLAQSADYEHRLRQQEAVYREMFDANPHPMWVYNTETLRFLAVNQAAVEHYGYSREQFLAMTLRDIRPPEDVARLEQHIANQAREGIDRAGSWRHLKADGSIIHVEISSHLLTFNGAPAELVLAYDITQRKIAEQELHKLNRYYSALSRMNNLLVRSRDTQEILAGACRIAVEEGELALVWVGKEDKHNHRLTPVASYGEATGYLDDIVVSTDATVPEGQGPAGIAFNTGEVTVFNHFARDRRAAPWQQPANSWNLLAVTVCPIRRHDGIWGVVAFYAREENYFTEQLVRLLEELTTDLAFSLDVMDNNRKRSEAQEALLLNARVIESSHEGMFISDSNNRLTMVNQAFCDIVGYTAEELIGQQPSLLKSGVQDQPYYFKLWQALQNTGRWEGEIYDKRKNGEIFPAWLAITQVRDDVSGKLHYIAIYRDISDRKAYQQKIEHLATHDVLTDLPNRMLLEDRIKVAIARADRESQLLALLFIDLDRFKLINDTLGHAMGDALLKAVAQRITSLLRRSDTVSRVGGDEFVVLMENTNSIEAAANLANKIISEVARPYTIDGHELMVTASAGIALYPNHAHTPEDLTRMADTAMMMAKRDGHNRFHVYAGEMGSDASERLDMQNQLRGAITRNEIFIVYHPQLRLTDGRVIGLEALARWQHERLGLVPPSRFIPIAEDSGLIVEIGTWILEQACRQCQQWRERGVLDVPVSVNVSALQFRQATFIDIVRQALETSGLPPSYLELEVTESMLIDNVSETRDKLDRLYDMGVNFAIDDFGTGYSSLSYLRQFKAHRLKIDRSFISDLPANQDAAAIARAIVSLSNTLGMSTIAEGVETEEQEDFLRSIWCEQGQGYLYSPPLSTTELETWLAGRSRRKEKGKRKGSSHEDDEVMR